MVLTNIIRLEAPTPPSVSANTRLARFFLAFGALVLLLSSCSRGGAVSEDAGIAVGPVTFEPCDPRVPAAPMPSDADLLELFSMAELSLAAAVEDGTPLSYRCVYAPGATLEFRDDEPVDLARFINGLIEDGTIFVEPPPLGAVRLSESESTVDLALIYPGEGFLPPVAHFELIDGNWLYASTRSGQPCEFFPSEVLAQLHPGTCR